MGICGVDQASSLDVLVLQDEIIAYVESMMRQGNFSDEALGFDEVAQVGPGGSYIDRDHTAKHFRNELFFPRLLDREYYQAWQDAGATDAAERCRRKKETLLETHSVEPLPKDILAEFEKIKAAARKG
jgi:trimethylamine--corrinoid protein Co-methyltransferase